MSSKFNNPFRRNYHLKDSKSALILQNTKKILINSNSYNSYLVDYQTKTQIASFKTPLITHYPVFRNPSMISLVNKQYEASDTRLTNKNTPFPVLDIKNKTKNKTEKKIRIRNHSTININQSVKSFRDHLLFELIPKYKYSLLQYDESLIFHNRKKYDKVIYDKFNLAKDKPIENYTIEKTYVFNEYSDNEIILTINSMKIEFINLTDKNKKPLSLDIPFSYLFLFYYKGIEYFKDLLLVLIRFTNCEYDCIELNDSDICHIIKHSKEDFNKLIDQTDKANASPNDNKSTSKEGPDFNKKSNFNSFQNLFLIQKKLERKSSSYYSKLNTRTNYHIYNFIWNTPKYVYNVNIKLPVINVSLAKLRKHIITGFEDELFLYILEKNFIDWDFYVISYLFSLKSFRLLTESILSKKKELLSKPLSKFSKKLNRDYVKISISTIKTKTYSYLDDSAIFFYTNDKNENYSYTLHSFSIKVDYNHLNPYKRFLFEFNFNQMKLLNKISQYENLKRFIKKIIITEFDIGEMNIDYSMFNNFNDNYFDGKTFKFEEKLDTVRSPDNNNALVNENANHEKSKEKGKEMKIKVERPWIEKTAINKEKLIINDLEKKLIPCDMLSEMIDKEIIEWPKFLLVNTSRIIIQLSFLKKKNIIRKNTIKNFKPALTKNLVAQNKKKFTDNFNL